MSKIPRLQDDQSNQEFGESQHLFRCLRNFLEGANSLLPIWGLKTIAESLLKFNILEKKTDLKKNL